MAKSQALKVCGTFGAFEFRPLLQLDLTLNTVKFLFALAIVRIRDRIF